MTNYTIWGLLGPATWPMWLGAIGSLEMLMAPRRAFGRAALATAVILFMLFGLSPLGLWLIRPLETRFPAAILDQAPIRDIVVLAGAEQLRISADAGRLEVSDAAERVIEGAALARQFPNAKLWIVGGIRAPGRPNTDSAWTAATWQRLGIDPKRIVAVEDTLNTCQNAEGAVSQGLAGAPLLVTSAFHMPRAIGCFRHVGIEPLPYPVDYRGWCARSLADAFSSDVLGNLSRLDVALHEWVGLVWYRVSGRTAELYPAP